MRILLINQYAGSPTLGMEYRPHWLALEWQELGHEVLVVAGDYSHLRRTQPRVGRSRVDGVEFLTLRTPPYSQNGPRRFVNMLAFRAQLRRRARALVRWRPEAVVASSTHPMDISPALRIARRASALFVHEVHDLWPLTPRLLGGMSDRHPMIVWMQREEDLACREADLVLSVLPATLPYLQSRGLDPERWAHVSNGVPEDCVSGDGLPPASDDDRFRVGYFGAHGRANDLETLIDAAGLLAGDNVEVHLWGAGPSKPALQTRAGHLRNVQFHNPVSAPEARVAMADMDVLYIGLADSPLFDHGISPNKMFEYMAVGRPIIQAINTPASPAVDAGCALTCTPGNPTHVAEVIQALQGLDKGERAALGMAGRDFVRLNATYPQLAASFASALGLAQDRRVGHEQGPSQDSLQVVSPMPMQQARLCRRVAEED